MGNITTTAMAHRLLEPGMFQVDMLYSKAPAEYKDYFDEYKSDRGQEWTLQMKGLGSSRLKAEGQDTYIDNFAQRFQQTFTNRTYSLGTIITQEMLEDNLYKEAFPQMAQSLQRAMMNTENVEAAKIINEGTNPNYQGWDGLPLFSVNHPFDGGTSANTFPVLTPLHEASLEQALTGIRHFRDQAGLLIGDARGERLVIPSSLEWQAERLTQSQYRTGTNFNDINAIYNTKSLPKGYTVSRYINPNVWFIRTNLQGLKKFERRAFKTNMQPNYSNETIMVASSARWVFGFDNWQAVFGVQAPLAA